MIYLEWLGLLLLSIVGVNYLTRKSAPLWTIGVIILVAVVLMFVLPSATGAVNNNTL